MAAGAALLLIVGGYLLFEKKKRENLERERYGEHRPRIEELRAALDQDICNMGVALRLSGLLTKTEHVAEARDVLTRSVENCPARAPMLHALVGVNRKLGRTNDAFKVATALIEHRPRRARGYALRAELYRDLGRLDEAQRDFETAFELDPTRAETARELSGLLEEGGRHCDAAGVLDDVLAHGNPDRAAGLRARSDRLRRDGGCPRERVEGGRVIVPFQRVQDVMVVDVRINDKVTARMLLDTGASSVALTRPLANRLGLDISKGKPLRVATVGGVVSAQRVLLDSVALGGARVEKVRAAVVEAMVLSDAEGLLGNSFLSRFDYRVDDARSQIVFEPRQGDP